MERDGITSAIVSGFTYVEFPFIVQNRVLLQAGFIWSRIILFLSQADVTPVKSDHGFPGRQTGSAVQCSIQAHIRQCSVGLVSTCSVSLANCSWLAQVSLLTAAQSHARKPPWRTAWQFALCGPGGRSLAWGFTNLNCISISSTHSLCFLPSASYWGDSYLIFHSVFYAHSGR